MLKTLRRSAGEADESAIALEERARIARELHDIVAHTVSVIVLQADAAHGVADDPEKVRAALDQIASLARDSMDEIRTVVGVLRTDDSAPSAPQPGLGSLDDLIAKTRAAGLPVDVEIRGKRWPVRTALDVSAYRIVQESLTNVLKHAGPQPTRVVVEYAPAEIAIEVTNEGDVVDPSRVRAGSGVIGMRERASLFDGTIDAAPCPEGGWSVRARLRGKPKGPAIMIRRNLSE